MIRHQVLEVPWTKLRCDVHQPPSTEHIHLWVYLSRPIEYVHFDFAKFEHQHYLLIVDTYSKWIEEFHIGQTTTTKTTMLCNDYDLLYLNILFGDKNLIIHANTTSRQEKFGSGLDINIFLHIYCCDSIPLLCFCMHVCIMICLLLCVHKVSCLSHT